MMKHIFKHLSLAVVLALVLVTASCSDPTLRQVAKFETDLNAATSTAFTVVVGASQTNPPLISQADSVAIVRVLLQIEQGDQAAIAATQQLSTLSATGQTSLLATLGPIETAVDNAVQNGTVNIKDPATKTKVQTALLSIQALLNSGVALIKAAKTA